MSDALPVVYLARHGETAWTISGQHTGATDLPLTARGEAEATQLAEPLAGLMFAAVFTSPLQRAVQTCELAGFGPVAEVEPDLVEWNYGTYEGRTSAEIRAERPDWQVFRDGCPGGESPEQVGSRADRVIRRVRAIGRGVLLFSSGHFLRVFAARWGTSMIGPSRLSVSGTRGLTNGARTRVRYGGMRRRHGDERKEGGGPSSRSSPGHTGRAAPAIRKRSGGPHGQR